VQFANGVGVEDCQEVFLEEEGEVMVRVPRVVGRGAKL